VDNSDDEEELPSVGASRDGAFTHFSIDRPCKYLVASTSTGTLRRYDLSITASTAKAVEEARRRMGMPDAGWVCPPIKSG
jgi:hypothetical protein